MRAPSPAYPARPNNEIANRAYSKVFWRILPFLMACYTVAYLDRINVSFAKLQMTHQIGLSETIYGAGAGIFFIGYFIFEVPSNLVLQRVGARRWIARIMVTWGLLSASFIFTSGTKSFLLLRFLLGVAEAGFYPGIIYYLTGWFPAHRRAAIVALFMSAIPLSGIFGNPLSGWILERLSGAPGLAGWQWMFLIEGVPAVLLGIAVFLFLPDDAAESKWLSDQEKALLQYELVLDKSAARVHLSFVSVLRDARTWQLIFIYFTITMGQYGLTFWMPTLIHSAGVLDNQRIGLLSAVPFLVAIVVMNLCARSADRRRERRWHVILPNIAGAAGFVMAACSHSLWMMTLGLSIAAAGVLTSTPLFWSLPTAYLSDRAAAGGIAAINSFGNLAGFVSPFLVGYLRDVTGQGATGMFVLAGTLILGAWMVTRIPADLVNR